MNIVELTLDASDLGPLYEFYAGDLGLPVVRRSPDLLALAAGTTRLQFRRADGKPFYHFAFNVHPVRFERARAKLAAITQLVHDADGEEVYEFRSWNARACYFYDPLGNVVEIIGRRDLANAPVPPGAAWLSIGEVGLVTDDVPALTRRAGQELGLPVYRDSAGEAFAAVGDAEGLLILVQRGRTWFPDTGKAAVSAPVEIRLQHAGAGWLVKGPPYHFAATRASSA